MSLTARLQLMREHMALLQAQLADAQNDLTQLERVWTAERAALKTELRNELWLEHLRASMEHAPSKTHRASA